MVCLLPASTGQITHDFTPVDRIWTADSLLLAAGARFDVLVQGGPAGTHAHLQTLPYSTGPADNQFPRETSATTVSQRTPTHPAAPPTTNYAPTVDLNHATRSATTGNGLTGGHQRRLPLPGPVRTVARWKKLWRPTRRR
ncbi:hypothetical protein GCM10009753_52860 [Streptantibioticus ferralitis]